MASSQAPMALRPGRVAGNWVLIERLATGGYGEVWIAGHARSEQRAAVKVLHAELVSSEESVGRLLREAEVIGAIEHPAIVGLYEGGRLADGRPYIAMELIEGETLAERVTRRGRLPLAEVCELVAQLADGLDVAHAAGVIHRDIKASNVMLRPLYGGERVVLLDFGIAKLTAPDAPSLTASQFTVGTPTCMAPEQLLGQPIDARTDVYALAVLAYYAMTGEQPFADSPPLLLPYLHQHGERPRPSKLADVPAQIDDVIATAMAPKPDDRYPTASALARALAGAQSKALLGAIDERGSGPLVAVRVVASLPAGSSDPSVLDAFALAIEEGEDRLEAVGARLIAETDDSLTFVLAPGTLEARCPDALRALAESICDRGHIAITMLVDVGVDEVALGMASRWPTRREAGLSLSDAAREHYNE